MPTLSSHQTAPRAAGLPSWIDALPFVSEAGIIATGAVIFFVFPEDLAFATYIMVTSVFVLSLALVLGQGGISSLGHAALYGTGAYGAGLFALHVSSDPLLGLAAGGLAGGLFALIAGLVILRTEGINLVMLTIAIAQVLLEVANKARAITGGDDGLSGFDVAPLFGRFGFDFYGRTAFWYVLVVLALAFLALRKIIASPFGLTTIAMRLDRGRMLALGCNVYGQQVALFTIGGAVAGIGGALLAQTAKVVSLDTLNFNTSAEALVMLVLGGTRRLPGALIGTIVYMLIQHIAATANPYHWLFLIGAMLILTLVFLPGGLIELADRGVRILSRKRAA